LFGHRLGKNFFNFFSTVRKDLRTAAGIACGL
jgi:hypothetical protein